MTERQFRAEIGFTSNVSTRYVKWNDVTDDVIAFQGKRGRSTELDRIEAGTGKLSLTNRDGRYTPGRDWLASLDERFNSIALITSPTFTAASGRWGVTASSGANPTIVTTANGIQASRTALAAAGNLNLIMSGTTAGNLLPAVTPGQVVRISYKVKATTTAGSADFFLNSWWTNGAADVSTATGTFKNSNGAWVSGSQTFTAPGAVNGIRLGVIGQTSALADFTLEVAYLRVEVTSPYSGNVKPRKPFRAYTVADDNYLHYQVAMPARCDSSQLRFVARSSINAGTVTDRPITVTQLFDATPGAYVFEFVGPDVAPGGGNVINYNLTGLAGDSDVIQVSSGQQVNVDGDLCLMPGGGAGAACALGVEFTNFATGVVSRSHTADVTSVSVYTHHGLSYVAPADGYLRVSVRSSSAVAASTLKVRARNLKVRLDSVGGSSLAANSGVFPHLRGYVEKWSSTGERSSALATATIVDGFSVLSQPMASLYRQAIENAWVAKGSPTAFNYWPCVEEDGSSKAQPMIGSEPLDIVTTAIAPTTGGFTSDKTTVYYDGIDGSGSFTVDDADITRGAALRFIKSGKPNLGRNYAYHVSFWYKAPETFAGVPATDQLFAIMGADSTTVLSRCSVNPATGVLTVTGGGGVYLGGGTAATITVNTIAGTIVPNGVYHVAFTYAGDDPSALTPSLNLWINGAFNTNATDPSFAIALNDSPWSIQWGGRFYGGGTSTAGAYMRGSINHLTVQYGTSAQLVATNDVVATGLALGATEGARFAYLMTTAGALNSTVFDSSKSAMISPRWSNDTDVLGQFQSVAEAASGTFFMGPAGELVYQNRSRRMGAPYKWTIAERSEDLSFDWDQDRIFNSVTVNRTTGIIRTAIDQTSINSYGLKSITLTRDVASDTEVADIAAWLLHRYRDSGPQLDTLILSGDGLSSTETTDLFAAVLGAEIGQRLLLDALGPTAPTDSLGFFIEGVETNIQADGSAFTYEATLSLSTDTNSDVWILESALSGSLDTAACALSY